MAKDLNDMTDTEVRARIIRLAFGGDEELFEKFANTLRGGLPEGTGVALRGSVVTDERYEDSRPFDADGPGTSDLDVTLIGREVMELWREDGFYIPRLHTKPLSDKDPDFAPALNLLRVELQRVAKRPVNFQATVNFILFVRDVLFHQPYYMLIEPGKENT